jgi:hypothetical protein
MEILCPVVKIAQLAGKNLSIRAWLFISLVAATKLAELLLLIAEGRWEEERLKSLSLTTMLYTDHRNRILNQLPKVTYLRLTIS